MITAQNTVLSKINALYLSKHNLFLEVLQEMKKKTCPLLFEVLNVSFGNTISLESKIKHQLPLYMQ